MNLGDKKVGNIIIVGGVSRECAVVGIMFGVCWIC